MRYPGGKGRCYQKIVSMMPPHRVYVETHLGGGAVLRHKEPAERSVAIDLDPGVMELWSGIGYPRLELHLADASDWLRRASFVGDELVYCDPPYLPETRRRRSVYRYDYTIEQHVELLHVLSGLPCPVMVSGYRSGLYDDLLRGWESVEFPGDSHVGPTVEVIWRNFGSPMRLHDYSHIGVDFREREAIRRRRGALSRRIDALTVVERQALLVDLARRRPDEFREALAACAR